MALATACYHFQKQGRCNADPFFRRSAQAPPRQCPAQRLIYVAASIVLHTKHIMRVEIERYRDRRMAEALARIFAWTPAASMCGVAALGPCRWTLPPRAFMKFAIEPSRPPQFVD
jgi:hypothetical protein